MHDGEEHIFEAEFVPSRHADVLAEIVALRNHKQGWGTGLTALLVSLLTSESFLYRKEATEATKKNAAEKTPRETSEVTP